MKLSTLPPDLLDGLVTSCGLDMREVLMLRRAHVPVDDNAHAAVRTIAVRTIAVAWSAYRERERATAELLDLRYDITLPRVNELLARGANVRARRKGDTAPLCYAMFRHRLDVMKRLLDAGADVNARDRTRNTALTYLTSTHTVRQRCEVDVLEMLCAAGADVDKRGPYGMTALHFAILIGIHILRTGEYLAIDTLIGAGADVNARTFSGSTPLSLALGHSVDIAKRLYAYGAHM